MATKVTNKEKELANQTISKIREIMEGLSDIDLNDFASTIKTILKMQLNTIDELTFTNDPEAMVSLIYALGNLQEALDKYDDTPVFVFGTEDNGEDEE